MIPFPIIFERTIITKLGIRKMDATSGCAVLTEDNKLYAFGPNSGGKFGTGNTNALSVLTLIMEGVSDFYMGAALMMVLKNDGTMWAAGTGLGSVGYPTQSSTVFVDITTYITNIFPIKKIDIVGSTIFCLRTDGVLFGTGANSSGQLGLGDTANRNTFTLMRNSVKNFKTMEERTFILTNSGELYGCGRNSSYIISPSNEAGAITAQTLIASNNVIDMTIDNIALLYANNLGLFCRGYTDSYYGSTSSILQNPVNVTSSLPFTYNTSTFKFISYKTNPGQGRSNFISNNEKWYVAGTQTIATAGSLGLGINGQLQQRLYTEVTSTVPGTELISAISQGFAFLISNGELYITGVHNSSQLPLSQTSFSNTFTLDMITI